jgi:hypothetical protein
LPDGPDACSCVAISGPDSLDQMFRLDDHEARLEELAAQLAGRLSNRREVARLLARGPAGAGRRTLLRHLAKNPGIVAIEPPGLGDLDAALCALVQAASPLPESHKLVADYRVETGEIDEDMRHRAAAVGQALADAGKAVALLVPHSWSEPAEEPDALASHGRARAFVAGLEAAAKLSLLVIGFPPPGSRAHACSAVELPPIRLEATDVDLGALRGGLRAAGERLVQHLRATRAEVAPPELRLRLALVALGAAPASLDDLHIVGLARHLALRLPGEQARDLLRLLLARRPLDPAVAGPLTCTSGEELALITACAADSGDGLRVSEPARAALLEQLHAAGHALPPDEREAAHALLAEHYQTIESAPRIDGLPPAAAVAWLEKLHHLAHGGAATAGAFRAHRIFARELLWARARWLTEAQHAGPAASLFRDSLGPFGDHPYAHHYYALNLDRSGDDPEMIERHYRDAVTFEPENPWWNARLLTFLIDLGSHGKARQEWRDTIDRVDPAGRRMNESSSLALYLHLPVAQRWLAGGHAAEARAILDDIPPRHLQLVQPLAQLAHDLAAAEASTPPAAEASKPPAAEASKPPLA